MSEPDPETPKTVRWLLDAVSHKLGRPAYCRKVRNRAEWYVLDPVFSHIQRGSRTGGTGYRVGFHYTSDDNSLWFELVHSHVMCQIFKSRVDVPTILRVARDTTPYRLGWHFIRWSSRRALEESDGLSRIEAEDIKRFLDSIRAFDRHHDLVSDLFPHVPRERKSRSNYAYAGRYFTLLMADRASVLGRRAGLRDVVENAWPLFQCLYPVVALEARSAALNRKMSSRGIPKRCEFKYIENRERSEILVRCRGEIEAAHIKPDSEGGSDLPENGLWLCQYHHRATEGRLRGKRDDTGIRVRFVARPR